MANEKKLNLTAEEYGEIIESLRYHMISILKELSDVDLSYKEAKVGAKEAVVNKIVEYIKENK